MLNYTIICPSPLENDPATSALIDLYQKRMDKRVHFIEAKTKAKTSDSPELLKSKQAEAIEKAISSLSGALYIIALDERGQQPDSIKFASMLDTLATQSVSHVCFIIGGAHGLSPEILQKADKNISLGSMVWPHRMVAPMMMEQLYRAQQINKNHPYHKA